MIPLREQEYVRDRFAQELAGKVKVDFFTQKALSLLVPGRDECPTCGDAGVLAREVTSLSPRLLLSEHEYADEREAAQKLGVDRVPAFVLRGPSNRPLRFFGLPVGNLFPSFIETILEVSHQQAHVAPETATQLKKLKDDVSITVYVTPDCPHSPAVVRTAFRLAHASSHVAAAAVEIGEFPRIVQRLGIQAVPLTAIDGRPAVVGAVDEAGLVQAVMRAADGSGVGAPTVRGGAMTTVQQPPGPAQPAGPAHVGSDPRQSGSGLILPR